MKRQLKNSIVLIVAVIMISCKPKASFTVDSTVYAPGELVNLKNTSSRGNKYEWTFPDGSKSSSKNPIYIVPSTQPIGSTLTIKLRVKYLISSDEASTTISVGGTGNLTFYAGNQANKTVTVDGNLSGYISSFSAQPACGDSWNANFTLPVGQHTYKVYSGANIVGSGTVTITKGTCTLRAV